MIDEAKPPETDKQREEMLGLIFAAQCVSILKAIREDPSAATLNVARAFLADNGVSVDTLRRAGGSLSAATRAVLASVPTFDDDNKT